MTFLAGTILTVLMAIYVLMPLFKEPKGNLEVLLKHRSGRRHESVSGAVGRAGSGHSSCGGSPFSGCAEGPSFSHEVGPLSNWCVRSPV